MSQPRVTVTLGRGGKRVERRVSVRTEMYADCVNGVGNRKRSIRDRLGGLSEPVFTVPQSAAKRLRDVEGQWKHDMYFDGRDGGPRVQRISFIIILPSRPLVNCAIFAICSFYIFLFNFPSSFLL